MPRRALLPLVEMKIKFLLIELNCETDFVAKNDDFVSVC